MQIALRNEQPRFDAGGGFRNASSPTASQSFDDLVRALGARRSAATETDLSSEPPVPERSHQDDSTHHQSDHAPVRADDHDHRPAAQAPADDTATPADEFADGSSGADAEVAPDDSSDVVPDGSADAVSEPAETSDAEATTVPVETNQPATRASTHDHSRQPRAQQPDAGAAPPSTRPDTAGLPSTASPVDRDVLSQLIALSKPATSPHPATEPATPRAQSAGHGAATTLLAHALVTRSQPGQVPANEQVVLTPTTKQALAKKALPKHASGPTEPQEQVTGQTGARNFKSFADALSNQSSVAQRGASGMTGEGTGPSGGTSTPAGTTATGFGDRTAQAARTEGPSAPHHRPHPTGPQFAERIGLTIARAAEAGVDRVSIRLNPRALGRIDVRMEMGQDGRLNLAISADRAETLEQLQRNSRDLERALGSAGFDTGSGDLNFSLRQQQSSDRDAQGGDSGRRDEPEGDGVGDESGDDGMIVLHRTDSHMAVDLFV